MVSSNLAVALPDGERDYDPGCLICAEFARQRSNQLHEVTVSGTLLHLKSLKRPESAPCQQEIQKVILHVIRISTTG